MSKKLPIHPELQLSTLCNTVQRAAVHIQKQQQLSHLPLSLEFLETTTFNNYNTFASFISTVCTVGIFVKDTIVNQYLYCLHSFSPTYYSKDQSSSRKKTIEYDSNTMKVNMLLNTVMGGCSLFSFILVMLMNDMSFAFQSSQANLSHRGDGVLWNNIGKHHRKCGGLYQISAPISTNTISGGKKMTHIVTTQTHALSSSSYLASDHGRRHHHHRCKKSQLNVADVTTSGIAVSDEDEPSGGEKTAPAQQNKTKRDAFPLVLWRFTRPHTLIGSALAIPALHILAAPTYQQAFSTAAATSTLFAMIPSLLMNLYITGLNQITDVEIDKINKPQLPIAAGDLSIGSANVIVILSLILSLAMGMVSSTLGSQGLNVALWGSGILGTLYSLPPFRLKRFPLLAAFCIVAVRGAVINAGFFAHAMTAAYGVETTVLDCLRNNARCLLSSLFFAVFGIVIGE